MGSETAEKSKKQVEWAEKGGKPELAGDCLSQLQLQSRWAQDVLHGAPEAAATGRILE